MYKFTNCLLLWMLFGHRRLRLRRRLGWCCSLHCCLNSIVGVHSFFSALQGLYLLVLDGLVVPHGVAQDRTGRLPLLQERIIEFKSVLMM